MEIEGLGLQDRLDNGHDMHNMSATAELKFDHSLHTYFKAAQAPLTMLCMLGSLQAAWKGWKQRRYRKASEALQQTLGELHVATILEQQPEACNGEQQPTDLTQAEADDPTAAVPKQQQQHETHIQILTHMLDPQTFSVSSPKDAGPASPSKHATGPATKARFKALNTAARAARRFGHQPAMAAQSGRHCHEATAVIKGGSWV